MSDFFGCMLVDVVVLLGPVPSSRLLVAVVRFEKKF